MRLWIEFFHPFIHCTIYNFYLFNRPLLCRSSWCWVDQNTLAPTSIYLFEWSSIFDGNSGISYNQILSTHKNGKAFSSQGRVIHSKSAGAVREVRPWANIRAHTGIISTFQHSRSSIILVWWRLQWRYRTCFALPNSACVFTACLFDRWLLTIA